jgi:transposase
MHFIAPFDRSQLTLLGKLDDLVESRNIVRLLDLIVDQIVNNNIDKFSQKGQVEVGRKAFHPGTLSKLFLYGYLNSISSSRKLEVETHRNIELIWLLGNLKPDHKTISDFRKSHDQEIRFLTLEFRRFLKEKGYISGKTISLDGTKIKAYANKDMFSLEKIEKRMIDLQSKLDQYLNKLRDNDLTDDLNDDIDCLTKEESKDYLINKIVELEQQLVKLGQTKELFDAQDCKIISPSDPDARLMKSRDGKLPGYNTQVAVDGENKMIALAEVTNKEADQGLLKPQLDLLEKQIEIVPEEALADKGYYHLSQIKDVEQNNCTTCYIPPYDNKQQRIDKISGISFDYDEGIDAYQCSQGKLLRLKVRNVKKRSRIADLYVGEACDGCAKRNECTTSKNGRYIFKFPDDQWVKSYKERMGSPHSVNKSKQRKLLSEHIFGTLKYWMGKVPIKLRSLGKVQIEIDIYTTSYNFKRLTSLKSIEILANEVRNYDWRAK